MNLKNKAMKDRVMFQFFYSVDSMITRLEKKRGDDRFFEITHLYRVTFISL